MLRIFKYLCLYPEYITFLYLESWKVNEIKKKYKR